MATWTRLSDLSPEELILHKKAVYTRYHSTEKHIYNRRDSQYKKKYGISMVTYEEMLIKQKEVCAICKRSETVPGRNGPRPLAVDHCHSSGRVRGLLCNNCNQVLGRAKDNIDVLAKAIKYLKGELL